MSGILHEVDLRTRMVGQNRLELLLFFLHGTQRYGINVFKVQEVLQRPPLTHIPRAHNTIRGVANIRGKTIAVLDLSLAIGGPALDDTAGHVIITEYSRSVQGFLVHSVDRIVNVEWEKVVPPPAGTGTDHFLTAVTHVDNGLVEILDVEKVIARVNGWSDTIGTHELGISPEEAQNHLILIVDDSSVARAQIARTVDQLQLRSVICNNGRQAYDLLMGWVQDDAPELSRLAMVISDVEMPEMDGYTLTAEIRRHPKLKSLYVVLHTSLSGVFNNALVQQVGADEFVAKFSADELARVVMHRIMQLSA